MSIAASIYREISDNLGLEARLFLDEVYRYAVWRENGKLFFGWSEESMRTLFANRLANGRLVVHRGEDGELDGLLVWFRVERGWDPEDFDLAMTDAPGGGKIFVLAACADSHKVVRDGILKFILKEPDVLHLPVVAWRRRGRTRKPRLVRYTRKLLSRLLKWEVEKHRKRPSR